MSVTSEDSFLEDELLFAGVEEESSIDYYAILNVSKDASVDEINKAYKHRCLIFHPDRHTDDEDKKIAAKTFVLLRKAHDTLIDKESRAIYDELGIKGLETQGWQLVERSTNSENIRKEYEFLKRLQEHEIMLQRVHPASTFAAKGSLCGLFQNDVVDRYAPQLLGLAISQSVDCALTSNNKIGLAGRVRAINGRGDGSFVISWKTCFSSSWNMELSSTISPDSVVASSKIQNLLTPRIAIYVQPSVQYLPSFNQFNPSIALVFTTVLQPNWHGTVALNYGLRGSALTTSIVHSELNHPKFVANLTLAPVNSNIRVAYNKRYTQNDLHYETSCTFSGISIAPSFGFERRLSRFSKIGASVSFDFPSCLLAGTFRLKTSLSNYELKLVLCDNKEYLARSTVCGIFVPLIIFSVVKAVFHKPIAKFMKIFEDKIDDEQINERRKEESQKVIHIMRATSERIAKDEERKDGLIIIEAFYGEMLDDIPGADMYPLVGEKVIDVSIPLQALVNDSQLRIYSTKDQLSGFYDPCPGLKKMLKVVYKFRGDLHVATVFDDQALNIPLKAHRVNM